MPVPAMAEPPVDHHKRFQAAVDVIHNLPKNGSYKPSYEVMLRFYGLYKQAVCGPCAVPRPAFWDPVGRYKWDAWSRLGAMSSESAMAAYVDEMKKVAQEVIDTMPMNEKTASLLHHFEPLYIVIDDMPRPPEALILLREGVKSSEADPAAEVEGGGGGGDGGGVPQTEPCPPGEPHPEELLTEVVELTANTVTNDSGVCEGLVLTSDSENEIYCDSVDSVEHLSDIKNPVVKSGSLQNGHESSVLHSQVLEGRLEVKQVGSGQGGEGGDDSKGQGPTRRGQDPGREGSNHNWRERSVPQGSPRRGGLGGAGGAGRRGGDGSEGGSDRLHDTQLQQQIVLALGRLREDMRSVKERLEAVERLAATHAHSSEWRRCVQCEAAAQQQEERWWPFDVSGQTVVLFLLWPFVAQGLVYVLRRAHRRNPVSS